MTFPWQVSALAYTGRQFPRRVSALTYTGHDFPVAGKRINLHWSALSRGR
ncbi:MAG: hypothetical protein M0R21_00455 [Lentimicrobiaceae bacterium]|nr:hypothetical protein [Lentimicrobiaceae bacterium]